MKIFKYSPLALAVFSATLLVTTSNALAKTVDTDLLPPPSAFSTTIDNEYWPLPIGASFTYFAETEDGCEYNKLTVTSDTHDVYIDEMTYTTLIVRDQEWVHEPDDDEECDATLARKFHERDRKTAEKS